MHICILHIYVLFLYFFADVYMYICITGHNIRRCSRSWCVGSHGYALQRAHIHLYMCIYMYTHIYVHIYIYDRTQYVYALTYICIYIHTHIYIYIYMTIYTNRRCRRSWCVGSHGYALQRAHICLYICIYIWIYIYICIYDNSQ